jgi:hypothetical protein
MIDSGEFLMSTTVGMNIDPSSAIALAAQGAEGGMHRFSSSFNSVPDDKLTYTPSPTCKNALKIAGHVAVTNFGLAKIILQEPLPPMSSSELAAYLDAEADKLHTREAVNAALMASHQAVMEAIHSVAPADVFKEIQTPIYDAPLLFFMNLVGYHYFDHLGQIDLLQTMWGDLEMH